MANYAIAINRPRVEIKIVRGFSYLNIVKMLVFISTFCRSTNRMIMKMTSKWDVIVICMVETENRY